MEEEKNKKTSSAKIKKKRFDKIPPEILFSPGGMILLMIAFMIEAIDFVIPGGGLSWKIILDIFFLVPFVLIVRPSFRSLILPFILERVPIIADIIPTWVLKMILF